MNGVTVDQQQDCIKPTHTNELAALLRGKARGIYPQFRERDDVA